MKGNSSARARGPSLSLVVIGLVVGIFGIIFYLQGNSEVGPTTSFMYSSQQWVVNGLVISVIGFAVFGAGLLLRFRLKRPAS